MASTIQVDKITDIGGNTMIESNGSGTFTSSLPAPTSGIAASAIDSGTIATARLGSGTASSSTFLRGDQTYAEAGGGLVYTGGGATTTSVSAIAINGCFSATYRQYLVVYDITPDTNGTNPRINFRDTSNNNITPSKYGYAFLGRDFGGGDENFQQDNDESALQPGQGTYNQSNSDYPTLSGYLWIINPFSATHNVNWHGQVMNRGNNGEDRVYVGSGRLDVQTQCAGLKFFFNSGNVNNATIKVYGLVDS